jgi:hypothetical protein
MSSNANELGEPSREYIRDLLQTEVDTDMPQEVSDLLKNDYPLANMSSADREYFRLLGDNIGIFAKERFPPDESIMQGSLGAALYDDPEFQINSMDHKQRVRIETALMDHFARTSRAVSGWQQDKFSESIQTNRVEDNRGQSDDNSRGILDNL